MHGGAIVTASDSQMKGRNHPTFM